MLVIRLKATSEFTRFLIISNRVLPSSFGIQNFFTGLRFQVENDFLQDRQLVSDRDRREGLHIDGLYECNFHRLPDDAHDHNSND